MCYNFKRFAIYLFIYLSGPLKLTSFVIQTFCEYTKLEKDEGSVFIYVSL